MKFPKETAGRRFLLIDGDRVFARSLAEQFGRLEPALVDVAETASAALARIAEFEYDLVLASAPLPDMAPEGLLSGLRALAPDLPALLLVPAETGLAIGPDWPADDVVARPLRLAALFARIELLLARRPAPASAIGPYRFRPAEKLLVDEAGAREIRLTEKEAAILEYLMHAGDRTTSRELLLNEVWGYNSGVTTHTLETHVYRLRRKIENDPANAEILVSEPGGYRLAAHGLPGGVAMSHAKS
jgi:DNA-binding response OmpR family regulator